MMSPPRTALSSPFVVPGLGRALSVTLALAGCGDSGAAESGESASTDPSTSASGTSNTSTSTGGETSGETSGDGDITDAEFSNRSPKCADYVGDYSASVKDSTSGTPFMAMVSISASSDTCTISSNGIPNHDFNDAGAFATPVGEVDESFTISAAPSDAASPTALSLMLDNAVFRNGVKLDLLAAACYGVGDEPLGKEKIGCFKTDTPWRYDPMSPNNEFGTDSHNAHTQPDGAYHYHGDPRAMYDDSGNTASGLLGWAADGYPIYGPWFDDGGTVRKAVSGYALKQGDRVNQAGEGAFPGGAYDGSFIDDYEFTGFGDLDECNGMTVDGVYGYYVTDRYPWVIKCFKGTPDDSFMKKMP